MKLPVKEPKTRLLWVYDDTTELVAALGWLADQGFAVARAARTAHLHGGVTIQLAVVVREEDRWKYHGHEYDSVEFCAGAHKSLSRDLKQWLRSLVRDVPVAR